MCGVFFPIGLFTLILIIYHIAEFLIQRHYHPDKTNASSLLITKEILAAYSVAIAEYVIESFFFQSKSEVRSIFFCGGLLIVAVGLYIRFAAIFTAKKSFTHLISVRKEKEHILVTGGIYQYFRHPSYFGFFVFAVGTQIMLKNPLSVVAYIYVLWNFFNDRIIYEEEYLVKFFGKDYEEYRARTPTRIPFIK